MNYRYSWQKAQLWLATNFSRNDLYITLSYDDVLLPHMRKAADAILSKFLRQLRATRAASGEVLKYIRCTHELAGDGGRRLHHHIVINAGEALRDCELIRSLWVWGANVEICRICQCDHYAHDDFLELAQYLARERNPDTGHTTVGTRSWSGSRNLKRWEYESELVSDNLTVEAPPGAFILDSDERRNEYGTFKYIKYLLPERSSKGQRAQKHRLE